MILVSSAVGMNSETHSTDTSIAITFQVEDLKKFIKDNAVLALSGGTVLREEL